MIKDNSTIQNIWLILLGSFGGFLFSLTGLSIGWLMGALTATGLLSFWRPRWALIKQQKGIQPYWRHIGQWMLGITLGQQVTLSVVNTFENNFLTIVLMLFLSILFALLAGFVLWRYTNSNLLTSLFATTPGGVSAMPSIAEEVGASTVVVSIVQITRIIIVVSAIPLMASYWNAGSGQAAGPGQGLMSAHSTLNLASGLWTIVLAVSAWGGHYIGKRLKLPAPWLVGGMLGVGAIQAVSSFINGGNISAWWPHWTMIIAQVLIGASIGSRLNRTMFKGAKQVVLVGLLSSMGLVIAMFLCSIGISDLTGIPLVTAILAFAPGGVAEMAATALTLHANSAFVVAVQVLRLVTILVLLPPMFRFLQFINQKLSQKAA
ncbi:membrane AbrB-like protein [Scopulibacillus daqui]|uniref:Membrane AbrB-like protein n=1 Tax=Scopulibacillus daqui TaxID=1469162 RepID=A0ABS2PY48_9BACL|nr:AbrB family transcriptional regulator [Scopulibacillus daqui]MBM7644945.1 membrane AbrB-like protein [Scopulibacillus daqui]